MYESNLEDKSSEKVSIHVFYKKWTYWVSNAKIQTYVRNHKCYVDGINPTIGFDAQSIDFWCRHYLIVVWN